MGDVRDKPLLWAQRQGMGAGEDLQRGGGVGGDIWVPRLGGHLWGPSVGLSFTQPEVPVKGPVRSPVRTTHSVSSVQRLPSGTSRKTKSFSVQLLADLRFQVQLEGWPFSQSGHLGGSRYSPVSSSDSLFYAVKAPPLPPLKFEGFPEFGSGFLSSHVGHSPPQHPSLPAQ